jgi:BirA family biotin operon repressor/biotin-[acetyl-CoA-carboxylase] ligase
MPFDSRRVQRHFPGRPIFHYPSLPSTMTEAASLAAENYPSGTVVIADEQTAGVGRHGHSWHSEPRSGLYVSMVLRIPVTPALTLALGLATAEAIARATDLGCDLRWPNDVMLKEKKVAGILVQLVEPTAIAGIGINVNHTRFPPEIAAEATSLLRESGRAHDREDLLICLLESVDSYCKMLIEAGEGAIRRQFAKTSSYVKGKHVRVDMGNRVIEGVTAGLDEAGFLRVLCADGMIETVVAGGVRPI